MHFYHALKRSNIPTVDGDPVVYAEWEDDTESELALRVKSDSTTLLIYPTDKIQSEKNSITVSIGAKDHKFVL